MSQFFKNSSSGAPVPPAVPTQFNTDINSPSVPLANVEKVFGGSVITNNTNGIQTDGSSGSNTLTIELTNRGYGTVTTNNATLTTIITFVLGGAAGLYTIKGFIGGFIPSLNRGGSYDFVASVRTTGVSATEIGTNYDTILEDVEMEPSDIQVNVSGNNVLIQVTGIAATTIDWVAELNYTLVN